MFRNRMPLYDILSEDAMATLDQGWRRLMSEIGVEFMDQRALDLFAAAGQRVEENKVFPARTETRRPYLQIDWVGAWPEKWRGPDSSPAMPAPTPFRVRQATTC